METECCGWRQWTCRVLPSAAGSPTTPSTSLTPPLHPASPPAHHQLPSLSIDNWDWLDSWEDPITPVVEDLEQLANSLLAEAENSQVAEAQEKGMVGSKTTDMESCWPALENKHCTIHSTNIPKVTYPHEKSTGNIEVPNIHKQLFSSVERNKITNYIEYGSLQIPEVSKEFSFPDDLSNSDSTVGKSHIQTEVKDICKLDLTYDPKQSVQSADSEIVCMDCVVNEEEVETTEYMQCPSVLVTEVEDLATNDDNVYSQNLLRPLVDVDIAEASSSDRGYESSASPVSDPDDLDLFPELRDLW